MSNVPKNIHTQENDNKHHKHEHAKEHKPENNGKDEEKGSSDWILYVSIAIVVLVIGIIFGVRYFYHPEPDIEKYTYNGFEFRKLGDLWYVRVQPKGSGNLFKVPLHFGPRDVNNISVVGEIDSEKFNQRQIYVAFDPSDEKDLKYVALSSAELTLSMAQALGAVPIAACSRNETEACATRPIKDCSSQDSVIYLKEADEPKVTLQGSCVLVEGKDRDLVRATDRLLLWWYGIMQER